MRECPKCKKVFDDSWKVCLSCGSQLIEKRSSDISEGRFPSFVNDVNAAFKQIDIRLTSLEKKLGIEPPKESAGRIKISTPEAVSAPAIGHAKAASAPSGGEEKDFESTIGLVWLNRIGLLAVFLGVAFFLKYAFDNRWIGELGRVIIGLMVGFGMIAGSEFARRKRYEIMAQGLHGGGVAILYLSIFAAFGFYHLIGQLPAFLFMTIVTLYCGFWSTRTGWISSAVIGLVGGFCTPLLIGPEKISAVILFSYVILLDLGVLFISLYKKWGALNMGSFFLTQAFYYAWYASDYTRDELPVALSFVTAFFVIFSLLSIVRNLIYKEKSDQTDVVLILANGIIYFVGLYYILQPFAGTLPGLLPLALACVYTAFSCSALKRCRDDKAVILSYVGLSVIFVTTAIPLQLKYGWVAISWAIEAFVLTWLGFSLRFRAIRKGALIIGIIALLKLLLFDYSYSASDFGINTFLLNERMFVYLAVILIIFAAAGLYRKNKDGMEEGEKQMPVILVLAANFVMLVQLSVEVKTYFAHIAYLKAASPVAGFLTEYGKFFSARELTLSILWVIYALVLVTIGIYRKFRALRIMALVLFGIAILKIFLVDLSQLDRMYRIVSFVSVGVVLIVASFFYQKYKNEIRDFAMKD
ncbi:MAG: DUF2339 domain-containing protein [Candidatus Omnitrophota bacterium]